jgi:hypothetical protein
MALLRIDERTLIQKIKFFILGKDKPNYLTRISVLIGFAIWLYFMIWQGLIFLSIVLMDRLKNPDMIADTFNRLGHKYAFMHRWGMSTTQTLSVHSIGVFILLSISLIGLIFIYRRKNTGYLLYLLGNSLYAGFTVILLGMDYFNEQISMIDKFIFIGITAYFVIGAFVFKKS